MEAISILVADDNADSAESLAILLTIEGHQVVTAADGAEALALADKIRPQAIFLDIGMPKLNGFDTCRMIRSRPWAQNTLLVAVTGWATDADRARSRASGFNYHFAKPIDPQQVHKVLRAVAKTIV